MNQDALQFLSRLLDSPGPSGFELGPARLWRGEAERFAERSAGGPGGNSYATINRGARPRVMFAGHIDEIGVMVTYMDDDGLPLLRTIGGWDHQVFVGQRVLLLGREGADAGSSARRLST